MSAEEIAVKLENHTHEIGSLKHRMNAVAEASRVLNRLASAMEVMVTKQEAMGDRLTGKVEALEAKPDKRWDGLLDKALLVLSGAFVAWPASGTPGLWSASSHGCLWRAGSPRINF